MPDTSRVVVLIVDDERIIADTLCMILEKRGHEAYAVYSAEEALAWCRTRHPDVVITDVIMNGLNGVQLATRLADSLPNCKVLLISGNASTSAVIANWPTEDFPFPIMNKPVHPQKIIDFIEAI